MTTLVGGWAITLVMTLLLPALVLAQHEKELVLACSPNPDCLKRLRDASCAPYTPRDPLKFDPKLKEILMGCLVPCLKNESQTNSTAGLRPAVVSFQSGLSGALLDAAAKTYANSVGLRLSMQNLKPQDYSIAGNYVFLNSVFGKQGPPDAMMLTGGMLGDAGQRGALADLGSALQTDQEFNWGGLSPSLRGVLTVYDGQVVAMPVSITMPLLLYRTDLFSAWNLTVPSTWDELVSLSIMLAGRDTDGDGSPDYGVCAFDENIAVCRQESWWLSLIAASYVQADGSRSGMYFDPLSGQPLMHNPAVQHAMEVFATLHALGPHNEPSRSTCTVNAMLFARGRCAVLLGDNFGWKQATYKASRVTGMVGIANLPGSTHVLDRQSNRLVECDELRCPLAEGVAVQGVQTQASMDVSWASLRTSSTSQPGAGSAGTSIQDRARPITTSSPPPSAVQKRLLNRPQPVSAVMIGINDYSAGFYQFYAYSGALWFNSLMTFLTYASDVDANPMRPSDVESPAWDLREVGFNSSDVERWRPVYTAALSNPNLFLELRTARAYLVVREWDFLAGVALNASAAIVAHLRTSQQSPPSPFPPATPTMPALAYGSSNGPSMQMPPPYPSSTPAAAPPPPSSGRRRLMQAKGNEPHETLPCLLPSQLAEQLDAQFDAAMERAEAIMVQEIAAFGAETFLADYRASINWVPPPSAPPAPPPPNTNDTSYDRGVEGLGSGAVAAIVTPISLLVLVAGGTIAWWAARGGRRWLKPVRPPMSDLDSVTLLVTDIEGSTPLWEALGDRTMERVVSLHFSCLRGLAAKHGGYEFGEEGDSLCMAFATPAAAATFAAAVQAALMELPYPRALLQHPLCCDVWLVKQAGGPRAAKLVERTTDLVPSSDTTQPLPVPLPGLQTQGSLGASASTRRIASVSGWNLLGSRRVPSTSVRNQLPWHSGQVAPNWHGETPPCDSLGYNPADPPPASWSGAVQHLQHHTQSMRGTRVEPLLDSGPSHNMRRSLTHGEERPSQEGRYLRALFGEQEPLAAVLRPGGALPINTSTLHGPKSQDPNSQKGSSPHAADGALMWPVPTCSAGPSRPPTRGQLPPLSGPPSPAPSSSGRQLLPPQVPLSPSLLGHQPGAPVSRLSTDGQASGGTVKSGIPSSRPLAAATQLSLAHGGPLSPAWHDAPETQEVEVGIILEEQEFELEVREGEEPEGPEEQPHAGWVPRGVLSTGERVTPPTPHLHIGDVQQRGLTGRGKSPASASGRPTPTLQLQQEEGTNEMTGPTSDPAGTRVTRLAAAGSSHPGAALDSLVPASSGSPAVHVPWQGSVGLPTLAPSYCDPSSPDTGALGTASATNTIIMGLGAATGHVNSNWGAAGSHNWHSRSQAGSLLLGVDHAAAVGPGSGTSSRLRMPGRLSLTGDVAMKEGAVPSMTRSIGPRSNPTERQPIPSNLSTTTQVMQVHDIPPSLPPSFAGRGSLARLRSTLTQSLKLLRPSESGERSSLAAIGDSIGGPDVSAMGLVQDAPEAPVQVLRHSLFGHMLLGSWRPASAAEVEGGRAVLAMRGMRVRIGCNTGGLAASDIRIKDKISGGRTVYTGHALVVARAVSNAAQGGMTLLSGGCVAALLAARGVDPRAAVLLYMGQHEVYEGIQPEHVFQLVSQALLPRLVCLWPPTLRTRTLMPGVLEAAAGCVAIVRISLTGYSLLAASDAAAAVEAEARLACVARDALCWQAEQLRTLAGRGVCLGYTGAQQVGSPELMTGTYLDGVEEGAEDEEEEGDTRTAGRTSDAAATGATTTENAGTTDGGTTTDDGGLNELITGRGAGTVTASMPPGIPASTRRSLLDTAATHGTSPDQVAISIHAVTPRARSETAGTSRMAAAAAAAALAPAAAGPIGEGVERKLSSDSCPVAAAEFWVPERSTRRREFGAAAVAEGTKAAEQPSQSTVGAASQRRGRKLSRRSKQPPVVLPAAHHPLAGYIAEIAHGSVTAVFTSAHQAAHWALVVCAALPAVSWQPGPEVSVRQEPSTAALAHASVAGVPGTDGRGTPRMLPSASQLGSMFHGFFDRSSGTSGGAGTSYGTGMGTGMRGSRHSRTTGSTIMSQPSHMSQPSQLQTPSGATASAQLRTRFAAAEAAVLTSRLSSPGPGLGELDAEDEQMMVRMGMVRRELSTPLVARLPSRSQATATPAAMLAMVHRSQRSLSNMATIQQALQAAGMASPAAGSPKGRRPSGRASGRASMASSRSSQPSLPQLPELLPNRRPGSFTSRPVSLTGGPSGMQMLPGGGSSPSMRLASPAIKAATALQLPRNSPTMASGLPSTVSSPQARLSMSQLMRMDAPRSMSGLPNRPGGAGHTSTYSTPNAPDASPQRTASGRPGMQAGRQGSVADLAQLRGGSGGSPTTWAVELASPQPELVPGAVGASPFRQPSVHQQHVGLSQELPSTSLPSAAFMRLSMQSAAALLPAGPAAAQFRAQPLSAGTVPTSSALVVAPAPDPAPLGIRPHSPPLLPPKQSVSARRMSMPAFAALSASIASAVPDWVTGSNSPAGTQPLSPHASTQPGGCVHVAVRGVVHVAQGVVPTLVAVTGQLQYKSSLLAHMDRLVQHVPSGCVMMTREALGALDTAEQMVQGAASKLVNISKGEGLASSDVPRSNLSASQPMDLERDGTGGAAGEQAAGMHGAGLQAGHLPVHTHANGASPSLALLKGDPAALLCGMLEVTGPPMACSTKHPVPGGVRKSTDSVAVLRQVEWAGSNRKAG